LERDKDVVNKIIEAAVKVFARHGYFKAPVQLIAEEAGVSKGLVFWYFRSKEELIVEVAKKALPTDVISECVAKELKGRELLTCVGVNYLNKYRDDEYRLLLINTLALANVNKMIQEELIKLCGELLDKVAEKTYGVLTKESIIKVRVFFGGLMCYVLNPLKGITREEYLENLINAVFHASD